MSQKISFAPTATQPRDQANCLPPHIIRRVRIAKAGRYNPVMSCAAIAAALQDATGPTAPGHSARLACFTENTKFFLLCQKDNRKLQPDWPHEDQTADH